MIVSDVVKSALRKLTAYASGEVPSDAELADGMSALQSMLRSWASKKILVFASVKDNFNLIAGTSLYTFGAGGSFNGIRPSKILGCYVLDGEGVSHPVDIIDEAKYRNITVKGTISRPYAVYPQYAYPLTYLYFYPVPSDVEEVHFDSLKPFLETGSFNALTSTLQFPPEYEEALIYNLAVRLASEFGKAIPAEVAVIATNSYNSLVSLNASNQVESVDIVVPAGSNVGNGRYSINSDSYR